MLDEIYIESLLRKRFRTTSSTETASNAVRRRYSGPSPSKSWAVGDRIKHSTFGEGAITHLFGSGEKISIAVKFNGLGGPKILDPRLAPIEPLDPD